MLAKDHKMRFLLLFGFLHWTEAQNNPQTQSYPDSFKPSNLGTINKVIDVTFTHNLPSGSFDLREEDDYTWGYFDTGMVCLRFLKHIFQGFPIYDLGVIPEENYYYFLISLVF